MRLNDIRDGEDALEDELLYRVGNQQIGIRAEEVADDLDELGISGRGPKAAARMRASVSAARKSRGRGGGVRTSAKAKSKSKSKSKSKGRATIGTVARLVTQAGLGKKRAKSLLRPTTSASKLRAMSGVAKATKAKLAAPTSSMGPRGMAVLDESRPALGASRVSGSGVSGPALASILKVLQSGRGLGALKLATTDDTVSRSLEKALAPRLKSILKGVDWAATQRTATSEHNAIGKRAAYQRKVMKLLKQIVDRLQDGQGNAEQVRVLGDVLGKAGIVVARPGGGGL